MPSEGSRLLSSASSASLWRQTNYIKFSCAFGLTYGSFRTSIGYLSTFLDHENASMANGANYTTWMITALLIAAAVVDAVGSAKLVVLVSQVTFAIYNALLMVACFYTEPARRDPPIVSVISLVACVLGGAAAAFAWTAQGVYFALAARRYAATTGLRLDMAGAWFASLFAVANLSTEVCVRLASAIWLQFASQSTMEPGHVHGLCLGLFSAFCLIGCLLTLSIDNITYDSTSAFEKRIADEIAGVEGASACWCWAAPRKRSSGPGELSAPLEPARDAGAPAVGEGAVPKEESAWRAACRAGIARGLSSLKLLLTSPTAMLLAPFNLLKGFSEVFISDYVSGDLVGPRMGTYYIGYLSALGVIAGALTAFGAGPFETRYGRGGPMIGGIVLFLVIPLYDYVTVATSPSGDWYLTFFYIFYGLARGVWESTNRAISASLFPHHLEQIFALIRFSEGLAASIGFFICPCLDGEPIATLVVVFGSIALFAYWGAEHINGYGRLEREMREASGGKVVLAGH